MTEYDWKTHHIIHFVLNWEYVWCNKRILQSSSSWKMITSSDSTIYIQGTPCVVWMHSLLFLRRTLTSASIRLGPLSPTRPFMSIGYQPAVCLLSCPLKALLIPFCSEMVPAPKQIKAQSKCRCTELHRFDLKWRMVLLVSQRFIPNQIISLRVAALLKH